jgi:hypothetical protein
MSSKKLKTIVDRIIKRHGPIIDLQRNPELLVEIVRSVGSQLVNENPCGGTPPPLPSPTPPPGPSSAGRPVTNEDVLREVLKLSRDVAELRKTAGAKTASKRRS